ncbi:MAG: cytochrome c nitrite reductase small subunit [Bacteroidetes bacterium]|nr:MAG: cytochrome c nitrite reductase small subunit [Bacteroidota bacterium]
MNIFKKIIHFLKPPLNWKLSVIILMGIFTGIFFLVLHLSMAASYLSDEPKTCINCHVMYPQYASWTKGSHGRVATCSDCHVPQDNFFRKYWTKATDGLWHATVFTMRWEPQVIQIRNPGINVVQENCIRCHIDLVDMTQLVTVTGSMARKDEGKLCWDCHRETPHGTVKSLSAAPHALVERLPSTMPDWLNQFFDRSKTQNNQQTE